MEVFIMKKSLVKLMATTTVALTLAGSAAALAGQIVSPAFGDAESAQYWANQNVEPGETLTVVEKDGQFFVESSKVGETTETPAPAETTFDPTDPYGADAKVDKDAPVNAFENVGRRFKTLGEAVDAYPDAFVMYDPATEDYVVFTNRGGRKTYVFENVQDALNAFPNLDPMYENGKYYVFAFQAPRLQYSFATVQEAYEAFGEDANPMYDSETGKYVVYTNKAPRFVHEFDTFEDAMAAFPGSFPMFENGKYYVFTTYEKVAGTKGTIKNYVEGKLQDTDKSIEVEGEDKKEVTTEKEAEKEAGKESGKTASKGEQLPETGEATSYAIFGAAALAVLSGVGLVAPKFKEEK